MVNVPHGRCSHGKVGNYFVGNPKRLQASYKKGFIKKKIKLIYRVKAEGRRGAHGFVRSQENISDQASCFKYIVSFFFSAFSLEWGMGSPLLGLDPIICQRLRMCLSSCHCKFLQRHFYCFPPYFSNIL